MINGRSDESGFSLIEVIAVLMILGIIATVVMTKNTNMAADVISSARIIKEHMRYAQAMAMKNGNVWYIQANGSQLWLQRNGAGTPTLLPGEDGTAVDLNNKYKVSLTMGPLYFDEKGRPYTAYPATPVTATQSFTVSATSGSSSVPISIQPDTGFIP